MPLVVADTTILFPGLLVRDGLYRKLLVVFLWGRLHEELSAAEAERDEIRRLADEQPGSEIGGRFGPDEIVEQAEARIALMEEHLPAITPTHFTLAISTAITKEVYDNATGTRSPIGGRTRDQASRAVAVAANVATVHITEEFDDAIPEYTEGRDRKDDPIIHTAVTAGAPIIISQDQKHIALDKKKPTTYKDPATRRTHDAVSVGYFIREILCDGLHFDNDKFTSIDGGLLEQSLRPM